MKFEELQTDLERLLGNDLNYYQGDPTLDASTVDFDVVRKRLINWSYRTITKLCYIVRADLTFQPVAEQAMYPLQQPPGIDQVIDLGAATAGGWTLTYNGQTTGTFTVGATSAAQVQTALEGLSNIGAGEATVTDVAVGFKVKFSGTLTAPNPLMTITPNAGMTASATTTPAVRQEGFEKRCVKVFGMSLNDTIVCGPYRREGLYNRGQFERNYRSWRMSDSGTPLIAVDRGSQIQLYYTPDEDFVLASSANNFAEAQILYDDMVEDSDVPELPEEVHDGIPLLAYYRAGDPVSDEAGALRRLQSANSRWSAEVEEIRRNNKNAMADISNRFLAGQRFRA